MWRLVRRPAGNAATMLMFQLLSISAGCACGSLPSAERWLWGGVSGAGPRAPPAVVPQTVAGGRSAGAPWSLAALTVWYLLSMHARWPMPCWNGTSPPHCIFCCRQDAEGVRQLMVGAGAPGRGKQLVDGS